MDGKFFALDIIRDWSLGVGTVTKVKKRDAETRASIKKLAAHYMKSGKAKDMDEAIAMANSILG